MNITPKRIVQDGILYEETDTLEEIAEEIIQIITESTKKELITLNLVEILSHKRMIDKIRTIVDKELFQYPKDITNLSKSMKEFLSQMIFRYYEIHFEGKTEYLWKYTKISTLNDNKEEHRFQGIIREKHTIAAQKKVIEITNTKDWKTQWEINPINPTMGYIRRKENLGVPRMYGYYEHLTLKEIELSWIT